MGKKSRRTRGSRVERESFKGKPLAKKEEIAGLLEKLESPEVTPQPSKSDDNKKE